MTAGEAIFLARRAGSVRAETAVSTVRMRREAGSALVPSIGAFEHACSRPARTRLLKAIKGAILVGKPLESGECRLTPMLGWRRALGRRSPNEYADDGFRSAPGSQ